MCQSVPSRTMTCLRSSAMSWACLVLSLLVCAVSVPGCVHGAVSSRVAVHSSSYSTLSSNTVSALHPVLGYHVSDADGAMLPGFAHDTGMHVQAHRYSTYSGGVRADGLHQPYPDRIHVRLDAMNTVYELDLHVMDELFSPAGRVLVLDADNQVIESHPHTLRSYWTHLSHDANGDGRMTGADWAVVTLHDDGRLHAVIHDSGETIQIDPIEQHATDMDKHTFGALKQQASKGMLAFKHSDLNDLDTTHTCGAMHSEAATATHSGSDDATQPASSPSTGHTTSATSPSARDVSSDNVMLHGMHSASQLRKLLAVDRWTNCYSGDNVGHRVSVGVAADAGYYAGFGSTSAVQAQISSLFAASNAVYLTQLNVFLTVTDTLIYSTVGGSTPVWNRAPASLGGRCSGVTIDQTLNEFSNWKYTNYRSTNSLWHLMTNCFPPAGTVGLAWIGTLCNSKYGTGVSSHNRVAWLTVAHEIGHNFGATHTFQEGQGRTGGIMDYGDGRLPVGTGDYQFNTKYSKAEMCAQMSSAVNVRGVTPYCWGAYGSTCGNGVVEPGEDCDDNSGCCDLTTCRLKSTSQCSGNSACCQSCRYAPTTSSCNNGNGYCSNGKCADAVCSSGSGLKYCGLVPSNPCRQRCSDSSNVCTDSYSSPNLNVPDGVVCSLAPYATCQAGRCGSAPVVTYAWQSGAWGSCSCSGTQTRSVTCVGSDNSVDPTKCTGTAPAASQTCTIPTSCQTYSWDMNVPWGACTVDCGGGTTTRALVCRGSMSTVPVANTFCTAAPPATSQSCNTQSCTLAWKYSSWSACSTSCGGGVMTRTATCVMTQNGITFNTDDARCSALSKQALSQPCNTQACATYAISYGAWSSCSVACGGGQQTRTATCVSSNGNLPVAMSYCGATSGALATSQSCNTAPCSVYSWAAGNWGSCTASCGGGTQSRTVSCFDVSNNALSLENNCKTTKPTTIQSCNTGSCGTFQWATSRWSACSKSCGGGVMSRSVACINLATYTIAPDASCAPLGTPPAKTATCNAQSCSSFTWRTADWSTCSAACGGGMQFRSVYCTASGSLTPVDNYNCDRNNIPTSAQRCNTLSCGIKSKNIWVADEWSDCSTVCGSGYRQRPVSCVNNATGEVLPVEQCANSTDVPMPPTRSECAQIECPVFWWTSPFTDCDRECGGGSQSRRVECRLVSDPDGEPVDASLCSGQMPSTVGVCNIQACPRWETGPWSNCTAPCNDGIQTRQIECVTAEGLVAAPESCAHDPAPSTTQPCNIMPCPHWHTGVWSACSRPCGGGEQTRDLVCRMPHDGIWNGRKADDDTLCPPDVGVDGDGAPDAPGGGRPSTRRTCNIDPCPEYYWLVGARAPCSVTCGGGVTSAPVQCIRNADGSVVNDALCLEDKPIAQWTCNTEACPNYEWFAMSDWSECDVYCGNGQQTRQVRCRDTNPNIMVGTPYELVDDAKCAHLPKPAADAPCVLPESRCYGDSLTRINGKCVNGACVCRSGYGGANCTVVPALHNVATNADMFSAGVPMDERLEVTWGTAGQIDFVSVLLMRDDVAWPFGQYVAQDIVNVGSYVWPVGTALSDIEGGDGYRIRVWYSNGVYGDSAPFRIADPCAYKACGVHGRCVHGRCECVPGYTGDTCAIGPCERAGCHPVNSQCNNDEFVTSVASASTMGVCNCTDGFTGAQCRTRPGCAATCQNGGDMTGAVIRVASADETPVPAMPSDCGVCQCKNRWTGPTCDTCPITCANGGTVDADCTTCQCAAKSGYFGPTCECRYYMLTARLTLKNGIDFVKDALALARFKRTLATDVAIAAGAEARTAVVIQVEQVDVDVNALNTLTATLRLSLPCIVTSAAYGTYDPFAPPPSVSSSSTPYIAAAASNARSEAMYLRDARQWQAIQDNVRDVLESMERAQGASSPADLPAPSSVYRPTAIGRSSPASTVPSVPSSSFRPTGIRTRDQIISINTVSPSNDVTLLSVYDVIAGMFSNTDSPLYHGVVTSLLDQSFLLQVLDPSGLDHPTAPAQPVDPFGTNGNAHPIPPPQPDDPGVTVVSADSRGLSTGAIIGIVLGVGAFVMLVLGVMVYRVVRAQRRKAVADAHELELHGKFDDKRGSASTSAQQGKASRSASGADAHGDKDHSRPVDRASAYQVQPVTATHTPDVSTQRPADA